MKEERYFYVPNADRNNELPPEETTHALRVLRLQSGDDMFLMDGRGNFYHAEDLAGPYSPCHRAYQAHRPHGMAGRESHRSGL